MCGSHLALARHKCARSQAHLGSGKVGTTGRGQGTLDLHPRTGRSGVGPGGLSLLPGSLALCRVITRTSTPMWPWLQKPAPKGNSCISEVDLPHLTFTSSCKRQGWDCIRTSQPQVITLPSQTSVLRSQQRVLGNWLLLVLAPWARPHQLYCKYSGIYWDTFGES